MVLVQDFKKQNIIRTNIRSNRTDPNVNWSWSWVTLKTNMKWKQPFFHPLHVQSRHAASVWSGLLTPRCDLCHYQTNHHLCHQTPGHCRLWALASGISLAGSLLEVRVPTLSYFSRKSKWTHQFHPILFFWGAKRHILAQERSHLKISRWATFRERTFQTSFVSLHVEKDLLIIVTINEKQSLVTFGSL